MTKTYEIECTWHTHEGIALKNNQTLGHWTGIMFCEESGHCYGLITDDAMGLPSLKYTHYFIGHYEQSKGISFIKAALLKNSCPEKYTLVKDARDGYCGEITELRLRLDGNLEEHLCCGARIKVREVELTPTEFNYQQREVEKCQKFVGNQLSARLLSEVDRDSTFLMDTVTSLIKENIQYQNSKYKL